MPLPKQAPDIVNFMSGLSPTELPKLADALSKVQGLTVHGKYLHYSELLRRETPPGLSHEWWWAALALSRKGGRFFPLPPHPGHRSFVYNEPDPIPASLHKIDMLAGGRVGMDTQITSPETRDQYYVSSLIEEAIHSSLIEGATTTRQVAKKMLREGRDPTTRSEKMIVNNFRTMRRIREIGDAPLTPDLVFELHALVTSGALDEADGAGRFRSPDEEIAVWQDDDILWNPPPAQQLSSRMEAMCEFANGEQPSEFVHPVIRAVLLHFWLAYDHPFVDGNGRTARALFYWSMLRAGYWLFEFISISQTILKSHGKYRDAFLFAEDTNDATYFLLYHVRVICQALDNLDAYIARRQEELRGLEKELRQLQTLNHRQRALLSHALRKPMATYTIDGHKTSHNVAYETARRDLLVLEERGLLVKNQVGKRAVFSPALDIKKKLSAPLPGS